MRLIKNGLVLIVALALLVMGILFASKNTARYPIDLIVIQLPDISIAFLVLSSLLAGLLTGWLLSLSTFVRIKAAHLKAERALKLAKKELDALRISGLKDSKDE